MPAIKASGSERVLIQTPALLLGLHYFFGIGFLFFKFQERRLAYLVNGLIHVSDAGKFHYQPVLAAHLDNRLGHAEHIHPPFNDVPDALHGLVFVFLNLGQVGLVYQMRAAKQIQPQPEWRIREIKRYVWVIQSFVGRARPNKTKQENRY